MPPHLSAERLNLRAHVAKNDMYYCAFLTAWASGIRRCELLGLKWENITKKALEIRQTAIWTKAGLTIKPPKTKSSRRTIDIPIEILTMINALPHYGDFVFSRKNGQPIAPKSLENHFKKILKDANLPDIRFHHLRHTHATILLRKGVHPKVVQERLGHSKISTTLDIYSHVIQGMQAEVSNLISGIIQKSNQEKS